MSSEQEQINALIQENESGENGEQKSEKKELKDFLHKDSLLPTLKSYQGDIAKFLQEKNKSFIDIAVEEKEAKQKKEKEYVEKEKENKSDKKEKTEPEKPKPFKNAFAVEPEEKHQRVNWKITMPTNVMQIILSVFLVAGGLMIGFYVFYIRAAQEPIVQISYNSIIKTDDSIIADSGSLNSETFKETILSAKESVAENSILEIKVTNSLIHQTISPPIFLNKLKMNTPSSLERSLGKDMMVGIYGGEKADFFLILKENDYGIAFRDMLEWEPALYAGIQKFLPGAATTTDTSFKDFIFSNKDTRAVLDDKGNPVLIYTFLDKETILITESEKTLKSIVDSYLVKSFVR